MTHRTTNTITSSRTQKIPRPFARTQMAFADDLDYYETDEYDFDESITIR